MGLCLNNSNVNYKYLKPKVQPTELYSWATQHTAECVFPWHHKGKPAALASAAQDHALYLRTLVWEKTKSLTLKYSFYWMCIIFTLSLLPRTNSLLLSAQQAAWALTDLLSSPCPRPQRRLQPQLSVGVMGVTAEETCTGREGRVSGSIPKLQLMLPKVGADSLCIRGIGGET